MFHKINLNHQFYIILFLSFLSVNTIHAQTFVFAQLTGSPINTSGWNLRGAAKVTNITGTGNSELLLCPAVQNQSGAVFYNQPINLSLCIKWTAEFDFRMYDGTSADGIAFCFLDTPPTGFVTGGGLGIPSTANGLKICFDTYPNCNQSFSSMPKVEIRWGAGYNECAAQPTIDNSTNTLGFVHSPTYAHAKITYDNGNINVYLNSTLYLTGFQQFNFSGYLGFTAGTGGSTDNHSIKNVIIYTNMPPSVAAATGSNNTVCSNTPLQIGTVDNSGYTYSWSPSTGLSNVYVSNPIVTLSNDNNTNALTKKYYVQTAFSNAPGCFSTDSVTITVSPTLPAISIAASTISICQGSTITFTATPTNGGSTPAYQWKLNGNNTGTNSPAFSSNTLSNNDIVTCTLISNATCLSTNNAVSNSIAVAVATALIPALTIAASANNICTATIVVFTATPINGGSTPTYQWQLNGINIGSNTATYTGSNFNNGDIISCVMTTSETCITATTATSNKISMIVNQQSLPSVHITVSGNNICPDSTVIFMAAPANGGASPSYEWLINGSNTGFDNATYRTSKLKNSDTVSCIITSSNPCSSPVVSNSIVISVYPIPTINMGDEKVVSYGGSIELNPSVTGNLASHLWTPAIGLNDAGSLTPIAAPVNTTTYQLDITTKDGCKVSATTTVFVYIPFQIPTAFTPNGDGNNDVFRIPPSIPLQINYFSIFDRWGNKIFTTTNSADAWDGSYNGTAMPAGAYIWIIEYKNLLLRKFVQQNGTVLLIR